MFGFAAPEELVLRAEFPVLELVQRIARLRVTRVFEIGTAWAISEQARQDIRRTSGSGSEGQARGDLERAPPRWRGRCGVRPSRRALA